MPRVVGYTGEEITTLRRDGVVERDVTWPALRPGELAGGVEATRSARSHSPWRRNAEQ
jgi:hypothetical protein